MQDASPLGCYGMPTSKTTVSSEALHSCKMSVTVCQATRCNIFVSTTVKTCNLAFRIIEVFGILLAECPLEDLDIDGIL